MAWLYIYRVGSLVLATIFALVAFALSAQSKAAENHLVKSTTLVVYSSMGIATGVLTLITMPIMFLRGNVSGMPFSSTVQIELLWTSVLWILWFVTGGLAFSDPDVALFKKDPTCNQLSKFPDLVTMCKDWQPIAALSVVTAVVLLLYTLVLLFVAVQRAMYKQPIWNATVMESEKPIVARTVVTV
ncbi:hypothetical protein GSI_11770 [Ganoderma sinense ZZ0214-1]|uniref:MARVEL domain-containing protein n=1 Tax=Ganoderma sinense ZZ0214-1 TaxID=1077348 RepID=A0A2G8RWX0_9APHY|nr:hypothetical protein GSI_11770 [Ganoderma sinense ZZ0214-1]